MATHSAGACHQTPQALTLLPCVQDVPASSHGITGRCTRCTCNTGTAGAACIGRLSQDHTTQDGAARRTLPPARCSPCTTTQLDRNAQQPCILMAACCSGSGSGSGFSVHALLHERHCAWPAQQGLTCWVEQCFGPQSVSLGMAQSASAPTCTESKNEAPSLPHIARYIPHASGLPAHKQQPLSTSLLPVGEPLVGDVSSNRCHSVYSLHCPACLIAVPALRQSKPAQPSCLPATSSSLLQTDGGCATRAGHLRSLAEGQSRAMTMTCRARPLVRTHASTF